MVRTIISFGAAMLLAGAAVLVAGGTAWGQTIRLSAKAVVEAGPVELGQVATISNAEPGLAEALAGTVVLKDGAGGAGGVRVRPEEVLFAVLAQQGATMPSLAARLQLTGAAECVVETRASGGMGAAGTTDVGANRALRLDAGSSTAMAGGAGGAGGAVGAGRAAAAPGKTGETLCLAEMLRRQVSESLVVTPEDLRISFETVNPLLEQPVGAGQRWVIRPLTRTFLGMVEWEAQLAQPGTAGGPEKVGPRLLVQARVLRRTMGLVSEGMIGKGEVVTAEMVRSEERWVDRAMPTWFGRATEVIGQEAQRAVAAGSPLDQRDFKPLELAARGDELRVYFTAGALRMKVAARALASGKLHDRILVRNEVTGDKFEATLIGKHVAVVGEADATLEKQLREER